MTKAYMQTISRNRTSISDEYVIDDSKDEWFDIFQEKQDKSFKLKKSQQLILATRARYGDSNARNKLIRFCMPQVARNCKYHINSGLTMPELISIGYSSLFKAIEAYDPNQKRDIRQYIFRYVTPRIRREVEKEVRNRYAGRNGVSVYKIAESEEDERFSENRHSPEISMSQKKLRKIMSKLKKKQQRVMKMLVKGMGVKEISKKTGLTRQGISFIRKKVLIRIRAILDLDPKLRFL